MVGSESASLGAATESTLKRLDRADPADPVGREVARTRIHAELFGDAGPEPVVAGRYRLGPRLGRGGMGTVYRAADPELGRDVAIKVLWPSAAAEDPDALVRELKHEAQALARVEHPNVLPCYDVGLVIQDGRKVVPFVVTELVEGRTLAEWIAFEPRTWPDVVDVFLAAGRGLAAVHAADMVHRDFKPSNVLIGDDGRVRVGDFGLARRAPGEELASEDTGRKTSPSQEQTARSTSIAGTLAYMAPEQQGGSRCAPLADQFAFCAALYEALTGQRPFGTGSWEIIAARKAAGPPPWRGSAPPRWLRKLVERGLQPDPRQRHRSMNELLELLEEGRWDRRTSVRAPLVLAAIGGVGLLVALGGQLSTDVSASRCRTTLGAEEMWNEDRRRALRSAWATAELGAADPIEEHVDEYVSRWSTAAVRTCDAATGDASDPAVQCLVGARVELETAIATLMRPGEGRGMAEATRMLSGLRDPEQCSERGDRLWPQDPEAFATVAAAREELARARVLQGAGRILEAERLMAGLVPDVDFAPLRAEILHRRGNIALALGDEDAAEALLTEAVEVATTSGHDFMVLAASNLLVYLAGTMQARLDEALTWERHARAALERLGGNDEEEAVLEYSLGTSYTQAGRYQEGLQHHRVALEIRERVLGKDHVATAVSHHGIGNIYGELARYDKAAEQFELALAIERRVYGKDSPSLGETIDNLGNVYFFMGDLERGLSFNEEAARLFAQRLPPEHSKRLSNRENRAVMLAGADRVDEALAEMRTIAEIRSAHPDPHLAFTLGEIGRMLLEMGRLEEAEDYFVQGLSVLQPIDPDHPHTTSLLTGLGIARLLRDEPGSAVAPLERALELLGEGADPHARADAQYPLAQALAALDREPARVRDLARQALAAYRDVSSGNATEVEAFLRRLE